MSDQEAGAEELPPACSEEEEEVEKLYRAPAQKSITEIKELDQDDPSLIKYKEMLLGQAASGAAVADPSDPRNVIVEKLSLVVGGKSNVDLDLTGDLAKLKETPFIIKEGCEYKLMITFKVQHEIVSGLRYIQQSYRKGIKVDKSKYMIGSYAPKTESHEFQTPVEEAPKGMIARGHYVVKSEFTDDDKHVHLAWDWAFEIKKEWAN